MNLLEQISTLDFPAQLPTELLEVEQRFDVVRIKDVPGATQRALDASGLGKTLSGKRVAIGVGSRGIANLPVLVRATVAWVRAAGAMPLIVPAMGSHGGATAEGQIDTLAGLGVDETLVAHQLWRPWRPGRLGGCREVPRSIKV
ncbi:MAG: hypothetical protein IPK16_26865 [Anaerolineales bacterium]|nr:hypothetical protein [Anaerolineales bacterium]